MQQKYSFFEEEVYYRFFKKEEYSFIWFRDWDTGGMYGIFNNHRAIMEAFEKIDIFNRPKFIKYYINLHYIKPDFFRGRHINILFPYIPRALFHTSDFIYFKNIYIDIDYKSPGHYPTTDIELERLHTVADYMEKWGTRTYNLRSPSKGMSGNGLYLIYPAPEDWKYDAQHKHWYKAILQAASNECKAQFQDKKTVYTDDNVRGDIYWHDKMISIDTKVGNQWQKFWGLPSFSCRELVENEPGYDPNYKKYVELTYPVDAVYERRVPRQTYLYQLGEPLDKKNAEIINYICNKRHPWTEKVFKGGDYEFDVEEWCYKRRIEILQIIPPNDAGMIVYIIECPFCRTPKGHISYTPGHFRPQFSCFKSRCSNLKWNDFVEKVERGF